MRSIPIGVDNFKELRDGGGYYVDKTSLISDILDSNLTKVFLYTRPRRFGKSLNLSMLDAYLNMEYAGNTWFDGLYISEERPDDPLKNSSPVIYLNMKDLNMDSYVGFLNSLRKKISTLYSRFRYLDDSPKLDPLYLDRYRMLYREASDDEDLANSMRYLCEMLEMHHGRRSVILVDEYDALMNLSYG